MKQEKQTWGKVRRSYNYPPLRDPIIKANVEGGAYFDFKSGDIKVGERFINEITDKTSLSEEACLEGILTHEVGHYMVFPRNLATVILSGKMINDFFGEYSEDHQGFIFQAYADMCDDTTSVLDYNKRDSILNMRTASQETIPDEFNQNIRNVMLGYLQRQAGKEYELKEELNSYLERMIEIEFVEKETGRPSKDAQKLRLSLFQFGEIVNDMIKDYKGKGKGGGGGDGEGEGGEGGNEYDIGDIFGLPKDIDINEIIKNSTGRDIKKALRQISGKISRGEYKQVKEWLKGKGADVPESVNEGQHYIGIGTSGGELQVDQEVINYYKELSKEYPLIIHKKPIDTEKTKKSFEETEKWRVNKEPLLAMPNLSGGLFLPGITRQIRVKERKVQTTEYDTPHLLVSIDSSGSMPDPTKRKSYAVLAGFCAARSYHSHESSVGVINFSGNSFYLPYTRDLDSALGAISAFQGGGTVVDVELLKKMLKPEEFKIYKEHPEAFIGRIPNEAIKKEIELSYPAFKKALESGNIDLLMFTDGGIYNLDEVLELFEESNSINRATIVLTDSYDQFIPSGEHPNVNIHRINKNEDIPGIVLKDIRRNLNYHAARYQTQK